MENLNSQPTSGHDRISLLYRLVGAMTIGVSGAFFSLLVPQLLGQVTFTTLQLLVFATLVLLIGATAGFFIPGLGKACTMFLVGSSIDPSKAHNCEDLRTDEDFGA